MVHDSTILIGAKIVIQFLSKAAEEQAAILHTNEFHTFRSRSAVLGKSQEQESN